VCSSDLPDPNPIRQGLLPFPPASNDRRVFGDIARRFVFENFVSLGLQEVFFRSKSSKLEKTNTRF
jgi:hypothetical protein